MSRLRTHNRRKMRRDRRAALDAVHARLAAKSYWGLDFETASRIRFEEMASEAPNCRCVLLHVLSSPPVLSGEWTTFFNSFPYIDHDTGPSSHAKPEPGEPA